MSEAAFSEGVPSGPVARAVAAEVARRRAVLGAAVEAMRPVIETLTSLKAEGLDVALSLQPPSSRDSGVVEGAIRCLAIHGGAAPEAFDYDLAVRADGSVTVSTPVDRTDRYAEPYWACEYSSANGGPAFLALTVEEAAVRDALRRTPGGGGFSLG